MSSLNGFGTTFYGECDYQNDGSYTSTYWIILAFIPIIPLYSARIFYTEAAQFSTTRHYQYEKIPINWQQVFRIWAFVAALIGGYLACVIYLDLSLINEQISTVVLIGYPILMLLLPSFLRYQAKKRVAFQANVKLLPAFSKKTLFLIIGLIFCMALFAIYLQTQN